MGSELSVMLISRLLLFVSLLLWQLGTGTGTTFNIGTKPAADNGDNSAANNCNLTVSEGTS
jgi:hypothetical protein